MLTALDLVGTFVFALSGAFKAVRHRLDWLGIVVLAVLTGVGGGLTRDLLLGDTPPAVFRDERFFLACLAGAGAVIVAARPIAARWNRVMGPTPSGSASSPRSGRRRAPSTDWAPLESL